jgi:hypothetical protein
MSLILRESLPELAAELEALLRKDNESELADQIQSLEIEDRCRCDGLSCATIYNVPRPKGAWRGNHRNILLDTEGLTVLDILDERIVCIEMLDRDQITQQVHTLLP